MRWHPIDTRSVEMCYPRETGIRRVVYGDALEAHSVPVANGFECAILCGMQLVGTWDAEEAEWCRRHMG